MTSDVMNVRTVLVLALVVGAVAGQVCYPPYHVVGDVCIYLNTEIPSTWQEARDLCRTLAGDGATSDLAIFPSCDTFSNFAGYLGFSAPPNSTFWVGAHTEFTVNNWRWLDGEPLTTGVPYWAYSEGHDEGEDCAAMDGNRRFQLSDYDCEEPRFSICSMPLLRQHDTTRERDHSRRPCPSDSLQVGDFCYYFSNSVKSWVDAQHFCNSHYPTNMGELFSPSSCDEFTRMAHHLEVAGNDRSHWVGASDVTGKQEWFWVNGIPVPGGPPFWATGFPSGSGDNTSSGPNDYSALMSNSKRYYLVDEASASKNYFICKLNVK
ncbi:macrophage mannose receptor 1-like [Panulirus ornatus]|uniref:macrophage mannose receptor 1-like n=1 Tax=Panulirus ornatus TaxID=150431 RepID=UPI003A887836